MSKYEPLGKHLRTVDDRNSDSITDRVLGINIDKYFMPSVANVIGTDLSNYKLLHKGLFACNPMHVGRDERLPVALYTEDEPAIVSPAYFMFEITDPEVLNPDYLMMWFRRPEFDRLCWLKTDGSVRGGITWDDICRIEVPVIPMEEQLHIVKSYSIITERIKLKKKINDNLATTIDTIFSETILSQTNCDEVAFTDIVQILGGGTPKTDEPDYWNGPIPFFTPGDVKSSSFCISTEKSLTEAGLKNCSSRLYPVNTTFVTCRGTVGNLAMAGVPMAMNQSCYALQGNEGYPPYFVYVLTKYAISIMKNKASGAVFNALVTRDFEMEKVIKPSLETATSFNNKVEPIFTEILSNTNEISKLESLSKIILARLSSR
ncbi:MAG: restriction endonuclease subunit S [Bilifractor sp.]|jgi:type I restriction enzyme S subunit